MVEFSKRKFLEFRSYKKQGLTSKISGMGWTKGVWILLDKISHIHGHLLNGGVVECLNVPQGSLVILSHHVDGYSLSAKTATSTNPDRRYKKYSVSLNKEHLAVPNSSKRQVYFKYSCHTGWKMDGKVNRL